ncbi:MAG: ATP-binding cassette domain-containing protein [Oscillospiraceae bacterium]|jgi:ABC-2 type transport system ATP-binding protein|nr:ATP-binding cassette domain-containing protein [Oscillospiraceae bacterium]
MTQAVITVSDVTKSFRARTVLKNVNMDCAAGSISGLVGRNGSGKTVLMKCILGLMGYDSGQVIVSGKRIGKDVDFPDSTGFIIEQPGFLSHETALTNLKYLAAFRRIASLERVKESIRLVGLDPDSRLKVGKFSMGMKQRLGIAQAIMEEPDILILDEPMNGLDNAGVAEIRDMLLSLKNAGKTIVLASHNREDVQTLCDKVYAIDGSGVKSESDGDRADFWKSIPNTVEKI